MKRIGVEKGLTNVADFLTKEGYSVEMLSESMESNASGMNGLDAVVTAGYNTNMMGFADTETKAPVINAEGLSPQEIKNMIDREVNK